jgi:hypothetical protein
MCDGWRVVRRLVPLASVLVLVVGATISVASGQVEPSVDTTTTTTLPDDATVPLAPTGSWYGTTWGVDSWD